MTAASESLPADLASAHAMIVAAALTGCFQHHAVVIQIEGTSYRLRQHADLVPEHVRSKALITPPPAPKRRKRP